MDSLARTTHVLDAVGRPLGRLASEAAVLLMGKHKVGFRPHIDCGDFVKIVNADKAVITGKKFENRVYYRHTMYPGGIKAEKMKELFLKRKEFLLEHAISMMLPKNKLRRNFLKRLTITFS